MTEEWVNLAADKLSVKKSLVESEERTALTLVTCNCAHTSPRLAMMMMIVCVAFVTAENVVKGRGGVGGGYVRGYDLVAVVCFNESHPSRFAPQAAQTECGYPSGDKL